jgi:hypothetical protein
MNNYRVEQAAKFPKLVHARTDKNNSEKVQIRPVQTRPTSLNLDGVGYSTAYIVSVVVVQSSIIVKQLANLSI